MNHGKQDTQYRGGGKFTRQQDAHSRTERQAEREGAKMHESGEAYAHDNEANTPAKPGGSIAGSDAGQHASDPRGAGSVGSPRASAKDNRHASDTDVREDVMPAALGDRDERERQHSEPGAGYGDRDRSPIPALRDVEGTTAQADLSARGEGGAREYEDVATTGLTEQQRRLGGRDDDIEDELRKDAADRDRHRSPNRKH